MAINPLTPFADVENLLERIDLITVMTVEIGYSGEPLIPETLKKIEQLARFRDEHGLNYEIQIDGSCNEKNFKTMREVGANTFVLGNTGIFKRSPDIREAWRLTMDAYEHSTGETTTNPR